MKPRLSKKDLLATDEPAPKKEKRIQKINSLFLNPWLLIV